MPSFTTTLNETVAALDGHGDLYLVFRTTAVQPPEKDRTNAYIYRNPAFCNRLL